MAEQRVATRTLIILAFSATAGVMVEFYDFFLYGYAAASAFPAIFFPKVPPTLGLVLSYLGVRRGLSGAASGRFYLRPFRRPHRPQVFVPGQYPDCGRDHLS